MQIDGSPFDWLEDGGPSDSLLGAMDDASTEIVALTSGQPRMSTAT